MSQLALTTNQCIDGGDFTDKMYSFHIKEACCNNSSIDLWLQAAPQQEKHSTYTIHQSGISYYYSINQRQEFLPWSVDISFRLYKSQLKPEL